MVCNPVPVPRLVTVPVLLTLPIVSRNAPPLLSSTRLFVPVTPPLKLAAVAVVEPIVSVPVVVDARVIGLAKVRPSPRILASVFAAESPRVTAPVPVPPNAFALVVPLNVPCLMVRPPVKVLAPLRTTVPKEVLTAPAPPARIALAVPF